MTVTLAIQDVAFGGKGIGRHEGKVVFVPFTLKGEVVEVEIIADKKSFSEGRVVRVREASPHRVKAPCPYFGNCGGCAYQHADYTLQLEMKWKQVEQAIRRIGKLDVDVDAVIPSPLPFGYRNRITVHRQNNVTGFVSTDRRSIVDIGRCLLASDAVNAQLEELRLRRGKEGHFTLREQHGERTFRQTNDSVAEILAQAVGEALPLEGPLLVDAYCGSGFFLKRWRDRFDQLIGIEWSRHAVDSARKESAPHENYQLGDVALHLGDALRDAPNGTVLILDPPKEGIETGVVRAIVNHPPAQICYVSCEPSTLARDLARLAGEFDVRRITPFDMFPQTAEIETLAVLTKKGV
ncbi:MAG TPA: TRAM domain-containing protein [Chthoniobacterales bacterium]